jgi:hypothetical protein
MGCLFRLDLPVWSNDERPNSHCYPIWSKKKTRTCGPLKSRQQVRRRGGPSPTLSLVG